MIVYFVSAIRNGEKFLIAGPYLTEQEATRKLPEARAINLEACPPKFRIATRRKSRAVVWYVSTEDGATEPRSWLGRGYAPEDQAAIC